MTKLNVQSFNVSLKWCEKFNRKTDSFTIVVNWVGEYLNTSNDLEKLSSKTFCGSGMMLRSIGGKMLRDASFEVHSKAAVARIVSGIEKVFSSSSEKCMLLTIDISKCVSKRKGDEHADVFNITYCDPTLIKKMHNILNKK
jgi:hypothetical protein